MHKQTACIALVLALAACGSRTGAIEGQLAEGVEATHVWVVGVTERAAIQDGAFRLEDVSGELVDLRFAREDRELGRMEIRGLPEGSLLTLERIWIDDEVAFPADATLDRGETVRINALRYGAAPDRDVDSQGTVLAVSRDEDALLVRPLDETLPDLRVVVTPGTSILSPDGDPARLRLSFGDTVTIRGAPEGGFLVASEIVVPRRGSGSAASGERSTTPARAVSTAAPREVRAPPRREVAQPKGKAKGQDRGRGKGRGRG